MAAPDYVPVLPYDRPRRPEQIPAPRTWLPSRPGDFVRPGQPSGPTMGAPGPDQGYALLLAKRFEDRLVLAPGEHLADLLAGGMAVATRRSSLFGRAPVIGDLELAFTLLGCLGDAPPDLVEHRRETLEGVAHHYAERRHLANAVPETTLRMTAAQARERLGEWRALLGA